jgi:hypothetical protein
MLVGDIIINIGLFIDAYLGYKGYSWTYIFIALLIVYFGYFLKRIYVMQSLVQEQGLLKVIFKLVPIQLSLQLLIVIPIYFIARLFS